ncbi:RNA-binding motif protein, X-linked-like-3 [Agrilus planipennis]|uniref:RNA-binding motif protein, X-linked-like-3 n=1 Tax=Agrilus planipennis TaxID=224129 RepID=A0A1W4X1Y8_AGRPL|nr:RNA-binding motif protein, X-linked-like-3 [Agrilus planipennis]
MFYRKGNLVPFIFIYVFVVSFCGPARGASIRNGPLEDMEVSESQSRGVYMDALTQPYLYALAGLPLETPSFYSDDVEDSVVEGSEPVHQKTLAKPVAFSYYKNNEIPDLTAAATGGKAAPRAGHHHEKGGGRKHYSEHHAAHGEKGHKGYKGFHEHDKGAKGHHDKESHSGHYSDKGGHKKSHHHEDGYHGIHHKGDKGQKGAKYEESGKHSKGHSTKGGHNVHKNDVFEKKTVFYDEHHEGGESEKHGGFHSEKKHKKGAKRKGGRKKGGHHEAHHGKKGHYDKGGHYHEKKGHKKDGGHSSHHSHKEKYGKKDGRESHSKWGHKKGGKKSGAQKTHHHSPLAEQQQLLMVSPQHQMVETTNVPVANQDVYVTSAASPVSIHQEMYQVDPNRGPPMNQIYEVSQAVAPKQTEGPIVSHQQVYVQDGDNVYVANVENNPTEEAVPQPTETVEVKPREEIVVNEPSRSDNYYPPVYRGVDVYQEAKAHFDNIDGRSREEEQERDGDNNARERLSDEDASDSIRSEIKKAPPRKRLLIALHDAR